MTKAYMRVHQPDGNYEDRIRYITTKGERYVEASNTASEGEIRLKIIEKRKNKKIIRKSLSATNNKEQGLRIELIVDL